MAVIAQIAESSGIATNKSIIAYSRESMKHIKRPADCYSVHADADGDVAGRQEASSTPASSESYPYSRR